MGILNFIPNSFIERLLMPLAKESAIASGKVTRKEINDAYGRKDE